MIDYRYIEIEYFKEKGFLILSFNRPNNMNAFNYALTSEFCDALRTVIKENSINCMIITGKGKTFSVGGDIREFKEYADPVASMAKLAAKLHEGIRLIKSIKIPIVAAINGPCFGAALGYACSCDLRYCNEKATFGAAFTGIGLSPDSSTSFHLPKVVGYSLASEMILLNRILNSQEAQSYGLVNKIFLSNDDFIEDVKNIASQLGTGPIKALQSSKNLIKNSYLNDLETHLEEEAKNIEKCAGAEDFLEGLNAFLEKRRPNFKQKN
ncbi:MAG: enoyl-CoA hydratase/isomerase family protein [Candidatus Lokiarchaeota archaeon]|nr:enoyl-CoA hydratase/isomerase family protein [Candidatus Lokiarchaeota archaeon]